MTVKTLGLWLSAGWVLAACMSAPAPVDEKQTSADIDACATAETIGQFDPKKDLFLAQFDIKTDTDDLHAAAAVATILAHPRFACVEYAAVSGTYGTQGGKYVDPETLFENAFGNNWVDAHERKAAAAAELAARARPVLANGGHVWIMEGGQSDVSAETLRQILASSDSGTVASRFHIVQHSDWNEQVTTSEDLAFVQSTADYIKIPDGNATGNGTPGFRTPDGSAWPALLAADDVGAIWSQAKEMALRNNGSARTEDGIAIGGYDNQAIGAGGLDFSDTSEMAHIFGYDSLTDVEAFVETFVR